MKMKKSHQVFIRAFFAGLAAPTALYAAAPRYRVYVASQSLARHFCRVGVALSVMLRRQRDELSRK
jgi:hypothetical protein